MAKLRANSCIVDGEAVACGEDGISRFELLLERWDIESGVFLYAFDLIELDGAAVAPVVASLHFKKAELNVKLCVLSCVTAFNLRP